MQNIKNFKPATPAPELVAYMPNLASSPQLESEDGQDWYACQSRFADDTIKIMYDAGGVIRSVVDMPVPERGNVYAVSMLYPIGCSVAEIAQENWPDGVVSGKWIFDGEAVLPRAPAHKEQPEGEL